MEFTLELERRWAKSPEASTALASGLASAGELSTGSGADCCKAAAGDRHAGCGSRLGRHDRCPFGSGGSDSHPGFSPGCTTACSGAVAAGRRSCTSCGGYTAFKSVGADWSGGSSSCFIDDIIGCSTWAAVGTGPRGDRPDGAANSFVMNYFVETV